MDNPCDKEKQAMEEAQVYLVEIAKSLPMTSSILERKPPALRAAIKRFDEANARYVQCLEAQYKRVYGEDLD